MHHDRERRAREDWLRGMGVAAWSVLGIFLVLAVLVWLLLQVRIIWAPLIFSVLLIYLVKPLVDRLEGYRVPRVLGSLLIYLGLGGIIVLIGVIVVPIFSAQASELAERIPDAVEGASDAVAALASYFNVSVEVTGFESWSEEIADLFSDPSNREVLLEGLSWVGEVALGLFEGVVIVLLAPVLAFYIMVDAHNLRRAAERLVPYNDRAEVMHVAHQASKAMSGFVHGQLAVALIVGTLSSVTLWALDLPFWLIVGMLAGALNVVPFIGPWVGGALGVSTALIVGDPLRALWVIVAFLVIQQIDNHIVSPMVLRAAVHLSPVTIILALLAGGSVGGLLGVLIAVPVTAVVKIIAGHLWRTRVLGESWEKAASAVVTEYPSPRLRTKFLRRAGRDTQDGEDESPAGESVEPSDGGGSGEEPAASPQ